MTSYDIAVPLIAVGLGVVGTLYVHWASRRLDAKLDEQDRLRKARKAAARED
jgi:hypothetical protein